MVIKKNKMSNRKGAKSSKSGSLYEKQIYNIISNASINGKKFNTQCPNQLGRNNIIDIVCNYGGEVKRATAPDWS